MTEVHRPARVKPVTGLMRVVRFSPVDSIASLGLSNDDVKTIGAAATAVGVLFALLGTNLRARLRRPRLLLLYAAQEAAPYWDHVELLAGDGHPRRFWLRLRVENQGGRDSAEDVQILVTSYRGGGPLGLDPRPLIWSGQKDWKRPDEPPVVSLSLPPDVYRHVDLVRVSGSPEDDDYSARVCVHPRPRGGADTVTRRDTPITFAVTAKNVDAVRYQATIHFDEARGIAYLKDGLEGPQRLSGLRRTLRRIIPGR